MQDYSYWASKHPDITKVHPNNVVTHGATEPVLSILDLHGFEIRDLFLIGLNRDCGGIIVESEARANEVRTALEPAYAVKVERTRDGDWEAKFDRRDLDDSDRSNFLTDITLKDGTQVMRDGRRLT